jgi:2',3'-cyclic-nucleotide 2'-phosphodiesterase (5'-nucleotidase family)
MGQQRRDFLKKIGALSAGAGLLVPGGLRGAVPGILDNPEETPQVPESKGSTFVHILQTTDVHCQIHPHDEMFWENDRAVFRKTGGYAAIDGYFRDFRKKNPHTLTVDTGDMFQGSLLAWNTKGRAMVPLLNRLDYDLYLPGNWDVMYYKKAMQELLGGLAAPKVCTNMFHDSGEGKPGLHIFQPYYVWYVAGIRVGFLGYTDHLVPIRQSPNYSKGIVYTKAEENLAHYVKVLREQEACDVVIVLAHLGLSQQIHLANHPACEGVDYILGGDTHERVRKPIVCQYAKVVEPGAFGSFVGRLSLEVKDGKVASHDYELVEIGEKTAKPDKTMAALVAGEEQAFKVEGDKVIGYSRLPLYRYFVIENTIDTLILDALRSQLPETDIVLSNGFRFCPPRAETNADGLVPITESYLWDMLPFDTAVRTGKVSGAQIMEWLEKELNNVFAKDASKRFGGWVIKFQGMRVEFKAFEEAGKRVQSVRIGGAALEPAKLYSISACERDGDPPDMLCRMRNVQELVTTRHTLHSCVKNYLSANSPVEPKPAGNAIALDAPANLLTQVYGVDYQFR